MFRTRKVKSVRAPSFFTRVMTPRFERSACSRHQKPNGGSGGGGGGPLLRFRSHFPDIRASRSPSPFFLRPTLSRDFGDPIDRPSSPSRRRRDIACLSAPRKRLNPRHSARGLDRSSHSVGDSRDDNRIPRARGGRSRAELDRTSLSRTRRTGCCIPEVILRSKRRDRVDGDGRGGRESERRKSSAEGGGGRTKKRLLNSRSERAGSRFPRDSFASRDSLVFKPERTAIAAMIPSSRPTVE